MEKNKLKLLRVLDIISETDEAHPVTANEIVRRLSLYGIEAERKSVLRDIQALTEYGCDILPCRDNKLGVYLASRRFEDWELKVMADAILSANFLTEQNSAALFDRICRLASADSQRTLRSVTPVSSAVKIGDPTTKNHIDTLLRAVRLHRKVTFQYLYTGEDLGRHPKFDGHPCPVSPYSLIWRQDKYYLIGNYSDRKKLSYYRLDRIRELQITDEAALPLEELLGSDASRQLREFVAKNIYNYSGDRIMITLRTKTSMIDTLIDSFGPELHLTREDGDSVRVTVTASNGRGLYYWLLQYSENVEVLEPLSIREELKAKLADVCRKYGVI